ncbi:MAG: ribonuclease H-like domain-containing protein [candidate division FCPU426 bacterium]
MSTTRAKVPVYLDIETSYRGEITIVGLYTPRRGTKQLVGGEVTALNLLEALRDAEIIKTYNGDRFDLPVIQQRLGVDLKALLPHEDIMYRCWRHHLKGGLKAVERQLGLHRQSQGVDGLQAMALWADWQASGRRESLEILLQYNREDVELLEQVELRLAELEKSRNNAG